MLWLVQDFETAIRSELDCEHEARNCEIAARYAVYLLFWQKKKFLLYWYKSTCGLEELDCEREARNCEIAARYASYLLY